jgi:hypothetical protein
MLVCALDSQRLHDDDGPINSVPTYLFRIPKLLRRRDFWEIHTHHNSVPLRPPSESASTSTHHHNHYHHYFDNDPTDQLVVIEMASRRRSPDKDKLDPALSLCIPARAILQRIASPPGTVFSWEQWGEGRALLTKRFEIERRLPYLSRVCGLRHITRKPIVRTEGGPAFFHVMDFHPGRASRIAQSRGASSSLLSPVHAVIEVPLPVEMQDVDPALISTAICQDALIVFEVRRFCMLGWLPSLTHLITALKPERWWSEKVVRVFFLKSPLCCFAFCGRACC